MKIIKDFDHVAIGVNDLDKARDFLCDVLGAEETRELRTNEREGFRFQHFELGGKKLELVTSVTPGEGGVGRYIAKHGEGFHHISLRVESAQEAIEYFESKGVRLLGTHDDRSKWRNFYLHPKDTFGALIQISEGRRKKSSESSG